MRKKTSNTLFKMLMCTALCAATFGSFRFAQASIHTKSSPLQVLSLPNELDSWETFKSGFDVTKTDVVARKYIDKDNNWVGVVVRSSPSNAVLHDLTSCLINADGKPAVEEELHIATLNKTLDASLISFQYKNAPRRAVMWFQQGAETASNRWAWRLISTTSPSVRDAPVYYQVEVTALSTNKKDMDVDRLKQVSVLMFNELLKH